MNVLLDLVRALARRPQAADAPPATPRGSGSDDSDEPSHRHLV